LLHDVLLCKIEFVFALRGFRELSWPKFCVWVCS
jgi:hypothetical protein